MIFSDFGRSESRFFVIFEVRRPILRILMIFVILEGLGKRKGPPPNEVILRPNTDFSSVVF